MDLGVFCTHRVNVEDGIDEERKSLLMDGKMGWRTIQSPLPHMTVVGYHCSCANSLEPCDPEVPLLGVPPIETRS